MCDQRISVVLLTLVFGLGGAISLSLVQPANAGVVTNGGFETGDFAGWDFLPHSSGSVGLSFQGVGATEGDFLAYMMTAVTNLPSDSTIESFLGLPIGTLDTLSTGDAYAGSAFRQVLNVQAGDTLAFDWNFLTQPTFPGGNDFAFVAIDGVAIPLADFSATFFPTPGTFVQTGFSTFQHQFSTSGSVILGFGVIDVIMGPNSGDFPSVLLVDNVVPEPATLSLAVFGGLTLLKRRRRAV